VNHDCLEKSNYQGVARHPELIVAREWKKKSSDCRVAARDEFQMRSSLLIAAHDEGVAARDWPVATQIQPVVAHDSLLVNRDSFEMVRDSLIVSHDCFQMAPDCPVVARDRAITVLFRVATRNRASFASLFTNATNVEPQPKRREKITKMGTTNQSIHRALVILNIPAKNADLVLYATNVVQKLTGNVDFPNPIPTVAVIEAAATDFHNAETAALSRAKGAATVRNAKRAVLVGLLQQVGGYVQSIADATPENGAAIIESAGFSVRKANPRGKRAFAVKQGAVSGAAVVTAATAGVRSSYEWQYSVDGGKTWVDAPATTQGKTTITGLAAGTSVEFRYRPITPKGGQGDWSAPTSLIMR
jgi:hypothetical protein